MGRARRLSAGQEAMWLAHRMAPDSAAYNITLALRVRTPLDVPRLASAVTAVADRHELLRSLFTEDETGPLRLAGAAEPARLELREVPGVDDGALHALAREVGRAPFLLSDEGPFRVALLRRAPDDAVLVVVAHHIVSDRTSQWILMRDLLDAYRGLLKGDRPAWSPLTASFDDHVEAEHRLVTSPRGDELRARWSRLCTGAPAASLPADRPRPAGRTFAGDTHRFRFPERLDRRVREAALEMGVTPFVHLLGVFQALLFRHGGGPEAVIGCPASTRFGRGMRDVVGYLVNPLVLRARFNADTTFEDAIGAARSQLRQGMELARYPFPLVVRDLDLPRSPDRSPVFQIAFTMVATNRLEPLLDLLADDAAGSLEYGGLRLSVVDVEHMEGQLDLNVELRQSDTSLTAVLRYSTDLFDRPTIERFGRHFLRLAEAAVDGPGTPVSGVSLMDAAELREVLRMGNGATA